MIRSVCTLKKSIFDRAQREIEDCQSRIIDVLSPLKMIKIIDYSNEI